APYRYGDPRDSMRAICGPGVADKVVPLWRLDEEGQSSGIWRYSGHDGLWLGVGNLASSRFGPAEIKAIEAGMFKRSEVTF
ncbi:hypothetical protein PAXRUDRAFT_135469, partial [Paxillus rubicundulus Ve08.2h10]